MTFDKFFMLNIWCLLCHRKIYSTCFRKRPIWTDWILDALHKMTRLKVHHLGSCNVMHEILEMKIKFYRKVPGYPPAKETTTVPLTVQTKTIHSGCCTGTEKQLPVIPPEFVPVIFVHQRLIVFITDMFIPYFTLD